MRGCYLRFRIMLNAANTRLGSARAFIRSLNILLKYARLYSLDHARTAEQFETAWNELHEAIPVTNESGLLLSASGSQLLLDGVPIEASPAERSFAQLLSAAGLASIQFTSEGQQRRPGAAGSRLPHSQHKARRSGRAAEDCARRRAGDSNQRNPLRCGRLLDERIARRGAPHRANLGSDNNAMKDWLRDPQKLLQLIAASEGSRSGPGAGPGNGADGAPSGGNYSGDAPSEESLQQGTVQLNPTPAATSAVHTPGRPNDTGGFSSRWSSKDEDILGILKLLTHLATRSRVEKAACKPGPLQEELTKLPAESQDMLRQGARCRCGAGAGHEFEGPDAAASGGASGSEVCAGAIRARRSQSKRRPADDRPDVPGNRRAAKDSGRARRETGASRSDRRIERGYARPPVLGGGPGKRQARRALLPPMPGASRPATSGSTWKSLLAAATKNWRMRFCKTMPPACKARRRKRAGVRHRPRGPRRLVCACSTAGRSRPRFRWPAAS